MRKKNKFLSATITTGSSRGSSAYTINRTTTLVITMALLASIGFLIDIYLVMRIRNIRSTLHDSNSVETVTTPYNDVDKISIQVQTTRYFPDSSNAGDKDLILRRDGASFLVRLFAGEITRSGNPDEMKSDQQEPMQSSGGVSHSPSRPSTIEIIVAHCNADLSWMVRDVIEALSIHSPYEKVTLKVTFLSKCGRTINDIPVDFREHPHISQIDLVQIPNVGGCDYAYAYFMNRYIEMRKDILGDESVISSTVLLFIKDTARDKKHFGLGNGGYRSIQDMIHLASQKEFACGTTTACMLSPYHDVDMLSDWTLQSYVRISSRKDPKQTQKMSNPNGYKSLQDFHSRALDWKFPNKNLILVCYGGTFAFHLSYLMEVLNNPEMKVKLNLVEQALSRTSEPTIEEHYMERTWAAMFSTPLYAQGIKTIRILQNNTMPYDIPTSISGAIVSGFPEKTCPKEELDPFRLIWKRQNGKRILKEIRRKKKRR